MRDFSGRSIVFRSVENILAPEQLKALGSRGLREAEAHFREKHYDPEHAETVMFDAKLATVADGPEVTVRIVVVRSAEFQLDAYIGLKEEVIAFFDESSSGIDAAGGDDGVDE